MANVRANLTEDHYKILRRLLSRAILATPSGDARNAITDLNLSLMRDADASGLPHLVSEPLSEVVETPPAAKEDRRSSYVKLIREPMFWDTNDREQTYRDIDEILDNYACGDIVRLEEAGIVREFYAVAMPVVGSDDLENEVRQFATLAEAEIWVKERERALGDRWDLLREWATTNDDTET